MVRSQSPEWAAEIKRRSFRIGFGRQHERQTHLNPEFRTLKSRIIGQECAKIRAEWHQEGC